MINIIQKRLAAYEAANQLEEENAVKEILQDIALYGLWRSNFFDPAAFQGGSSLRLWSDRFFLKKVDQLLEEVMGTNEH